MSRPTASRLWYEAVRFAAWMIGIAFFGVRCHGRRNFPTSGGFLVLSNHLSHLDPPLVGMVVPQQINYLARQTLFRNPLFGLLIRSLDAIPIDRDGLGIGGLKETLRRLKRGESVLLFPEGTRSPNGAMQPLKPGFSALVDRGGSQLVPVAIAGTFDAFPRGARLPRFGSIHICIGPPISLATARSLNDRELVQRADEQIRACLAKAQAHRARITRD